MSMGSSSDDVIPVRRNTPREESPGDSYRPSTNSEPPEEAQTDNVAQGMDPSNPTYVAVGGGLSQQRIVAKLPQEMYGAAPEEASLAQIVKYMISPDIATSDVDKTVVDDVKERLELPDCRLLVNNVAGLGERYNLEKRHLEDKLGQYLVTKRQQTSNGTVEVNFSDIAIVTHDEGGYQRLEQLCL